MVDGGAVLVELDYRVAVRLTWRAPAPSAPVASSDQVLPFNRRRGAAPSSAIAEAVADRQAELRGCLGGAAASSSPTRRRPMRIAPPAARDRDAVGRRSRRSLPGAPAALGAARVVAADLFAAAPYERAGLRIAAADQVVDLGDGPLPIDRGVLVAAERIVGRARLVLQRRAAAYRRRSGRPTRAPCRRRAGTACRSRASRRCRPAPIAASRLQQDRAGVDAGIDPEDAHARARLALDDLPRDGAAAAIARQQRRVKADAAQLRGLEHWRQARSGSRRPAPRGRRRTRPTSRATSAPFSDLCWCAGMPNAAARAALNGSALAPGWSGGQ